MEGSKELVQDSGKPAPVPPKHAFTPSLYSPEVRDYYLLCRKCSWTQQGGGGSHVCKLHTQGQETKDPQLLLSSWEAQAPFLTLCSQL